MKKIIHIFILFLSIATGALINQEAQAKLSPDDVAEQFFVKWQRHQHQQSYQLLSWQLSQSIPLTQWEELLSIIKNEWGRLQESQAVILPFHERIGEGSFLSPSIPSDKVKRYTYELKFDQATINCDITVAPQGQENRIYWVSFWGSSIYMKAPIQEKMQELFIPQESAQTQPEASGNE